MKLNIVLFALIIIISMTALGCSDTTTPQETTTTKNQDVDVGTAGDELFMQGYWLTVPKGYECVGGYNGWMFVPATCTPKRSDFDHTIWFDYGFVIFNGAIEDAKRRAIDDYNGACFDIDTTDWELETLAFTCFYSAEGGKPGMVLGLVHDSYYLDATMVANNMDVDMKEYQNILIDFAKEAIKWQPEGTSPPE